MEGLTFKLDSKIHFSKFWSILFFDHLYPLPLLLLGPNETDLFLLEYLQLVTTLINFLAYL